MGRRCCTGVVMSGHLTSCLGLGISANVSCVMGSFDIRCVVLSSTSVAGLRLNVNWSMAGRGSNF